MTVKITENGHIFAAPGDCGDMLLDYIGASGYEEEFIIALSFEPRFLAGLMAAGFLIMSVRYQGRVIVLAKHHTARSVLFFENLHAGRTVSRLLSRYELRAGADWELVTAGCVARHGDDWLTPPLLESLSEIRNSTESPARPFSFALYRGGVLCAGEFGVIAGGVYTSYSGYYTEPSAGRAQLVLTGRYLAERGFAFWDLGMPLAYKYTIGAHDVDGAEFVRLFRAARRKTERIL